MSRRFFFICRTSLLFVPFFLGLGCRFSFLEMELRRGEKALERQENTEALNRFENVVKRSPESEQALRAARLGQNLGYLVSKDYPRAVFFLNHLILRSPNSQERKEAQKTLADIYFSRLFDYEKAIEEYNRLLLLPYSLEEEVLYRTSIARAYSYRNNPLQARIELENLLERSLNVDQTFQVQLLLAQVNFASRDLAAATQIYEKLLADHPERAWRESVPTSLAVCYEESDEFDKAISLLEKMREAGQDPEFVALKVERLQERKANLPGIRGLRK